MSDAYHDFTERLNTLLSANLAADDARLEVNYALPEITSIREADCPEVMLEIHAACHDDPVRRPAEVDDIEPGAAGPWDRRDVTLVVTLPCDTGECVTAKLSFATEDADDAGSRRVSFHWRFDEVGDPGLAEMSFHDSKTFKLDYFSVTPPNYVRSFVALCVKAYGETCSGAQIGDNLSALKELTQELAKAAQLSDEARHAEKSPTTEASPVHSGTTMLVPPQADEGVRPNPPAHTHSARSCTATAVNEFLKAD